jgi:dethiobiotin synthetase/adenosylmethionine--8-amino-7-oxononanoate aminotransferase
MLPFHGCGLSSGYRASSSQAFFEGVQKTLNTHSLQDDVGGSGYVGGPMGLHFRPLGNVAYLMTSLNTPRTTIQALQHAILDSLP